jgi:hypothetical protein
MPRHLLNPFQRVFAMSLGMNSEVDYDSDDEFARVNYGCYSIRIPNRIPK